MKTQGAGKQRITESLLSGNSDYGSEGWGFDPLRLHAHHYQRLMVAQAASTLCPLWFILVFRFTLQ